MCHRDITIIKYLKNFLKCEIAISYNHHKISKITILADIRKLEKSFPLLERSSIFLKFVEKIITITSKSQCPHK